MFAVKRHRPERAYDRLGSRHMPLVSGLGADQGGVWRIPQANLKS
jgi:hypothetical protein